MGVKVESPNVSKERLGEIQAVAEKLLERGFKETQLQQYLASTYMCGVSLVYTAKDTVLTLHSISV